MAKLNQQELETIESLRDENLRLKTLLKSITETLSPIPKLKFLEILQSVPVQTSNVPDEVTNALGMLTYNLLKSMLGDTRKRDYSVKLFLNLISLKLDIAARYFQECKVEIEKKLSPHIELGRTICEDDEPNYDDD